MELEMEYAPFFTSLQATLFCPLSQTLTATPGLARDVKSPNPRLVAMLVVGRVQP